MAKRYTRQTTVFTPQDLPSRRDLPKSAADHVIRGYSQFDRPPL